MPIITITTSLESGKVDIGVSALKGQGCAQLTSDLIKNLGGKVESVQKTAEWFQQNIQSNTQINKQQACLNTRLCG